MIKKVSSRPFVITTWRKYVVTKDYQTSHGRRRLLDEHQGLQRRIKILQQQRNAFRSQATNPSSEDAASEISPLENELAVALGIYSRIEDTFRSIIAPKPIGTQTLQIGHVLTVLIDGDKSMIVEIGGYGEEDDRLTPKVVSYKQNPWARLLKKSVGEEITIQNHTYKILHIQLREEYAANYKVSEAA